MTRAAIGTVVEHRDSVASTMDAVRDLDEPGAVLVADVQTDGRGRLDRDWVSPEGGLYASVELPDDVPADRLGLVPLWAGLAVAETLDRWDLDAELAWPNDVLVHDQKIGGILSESRIEGAAGRVVLGVGLNVNNDPPDDVRVPATSMVRELGVEVEIGEVLNALMTAWDGRYQAFQDDPTAFLPDYRDRCTTLSHPVSCSRTDGDEIVGRAESVDEDGSLVLTTKDGPIRLGSGDVHSLEADP